MPRSAAHSTLAYLFGKLKDDEELEPQESVIRKIGRGTFKREAGTGRERDEQYMAAKCDCKFARKDMLLENLQLFRLNDTHQKSSLKNSATHALKKLIEVDKSTKSRLSGRLNVVSKLLDTRDDQTRPEDYEFRHCLKSILTFDPIEKAYLIDDVSSEHGEPALDTIFLSSPPAMDSRRRRNAFGAVQLCPHSLNKFLGDKGCWQPKREECVIDFLTNVASLNHELVQPRAGTRRAESLYFESMYNHIIPKGNM